MLLKQELNDVHKGFSELAKQRLKSFCLELMKKPVARLQVKTDSDQVAVEFVCNLLDLILADSSMVKTAALFF
nr:hypothetical protein BCU50_07690 [Vibrio sp. 10N.286.46.E10]